MLLAAVEELCCHLIGIIRVHHNVVPHHINGSHRVKAIFCADGLHLVIFFGGVLIVPLETGQINQWLLMRHCGQDRLRLYFDAERLILALFIQFRHEQIEAVVKIALNDFARAHNGRSKRQLRIGQWLVIRAADDAVVQVSALNFPRQRALIPRICVAAHSACIGHAQLVDGTSIRLCATEVFQVHQNGSRLVHTVGTVLENRLCMVAQIGTAHIQLIVTGHSHTETIVFCFTAHGIPQGVAIGIKALRACQIELFFAK